MYIADFKDLTRQGILNFISTIYDPLGLISPAILMAKRIVQELTKKKVAWDEPITEPELTAWKLWVEELDMLTAFKTPRCLKPWNFGQVRDVQLHYFSNASQVAYGVVSYIRYVNTSGIVHTVQLCSKSRLTPLKTITIPRLELCAAALDVQVNQSLRQELDFEVGMPYFWTDIMIVLRYIRNNDKRFQTYVANRLFIIPNGSQPTQWGYVPTDLNPADDVLRGLSFNELIESIHWRVGPEFLCCDQIKWPEITNTTNNDKDGQLEVIKPKMYSSTLVSSEPSAVDRLLSKFSSWYALKKAVAWLLRVKSLLKHIVIQKRGSGAGVLQFDERITVNELNDAEKATIAHEQRQCFHLEITCLINNTAVPSNSPIYKLRPILTVGRTLCVGGRLKNANIPFMAQHQVILPGGHHVSALIVQWVHRINGHCRQEHVMAILREKYWHTKARQVIRKELRSCVTCKRRRAEPGQQKIADLPSDRVITNG